MRHTSCAVRAPLCVDVMRNVLPGLLPRAVVGSTTFGKFSAFAALKLCAELEPRPARQLELLGQTEVHLPEPSAVEPEVLRAAITVIDEAAVRAADRREEPVPAVGGLDGERASRLGARRVERLRRLVCRERQLCVGVDVLREIEDRDGPRNRIGDEANHAQRFPRFVETHSIDH